MKLKVCVVIPCYKVKNKIIHVIKKINSHPIDKIILVDDCCPQNSGNYVKQNIKNKNVHFIFLKKNTGVGGATLAGFIYALKNNFDIIIKVDGDGQHNTIILKDFIKNLTSRYDMVKGYRDLGLKKLLNKKMPIIRILGTKVLTFLVSITTWDFKVKDACHGLIGFNSKFLRKINLKKIKKNYFFEQDILFYTLLKRGKVKYLRNEIFYKDEISSLAPIKIIFPFLSYHFLNLFIKIGSVFNQKD